MVTRCCFRCRRNGRTRPATRRATGRQLCKGQWAGFRGYLCPSCLTADDMQVIYSEPILTEHKK